MSKTSKIVAIAAIAGSLILPIAAFAQTTTPASATHVKMSTVSGTVSSVSGSNLSLNASSGTTFTVDTSNAKIFRKFGATVQISDIQNGDTVQVRGTLSGSAITATIIRDMSLQAKNGSFSGTVSSVSTSGFILATKSRGNQTINTSASTVFKKNGQAASLTDLTQGETVTVAGVWDSTNTNVAASRVAIIIKTVNTVGTVSSVTGTTINLAGKNGTAYTVNTTGAKLSRHYGAALLITDIQNGDTLSVTGQVLGTNIAAKKIRDDSLQARYGTFSGTVSAVSSTGFSLQSKDRGAQTVNTTSTTVFKKGNQTARLTDVTVGQTVSVGGVWDRTNSNVTANRVTIKVSYSTITGTLSSVNGTTLTLTGSNSSTYTVDASKATVMYKGGRKGDISILLTNDQLQVRGQMVSGSAKMSASSVRDLSQAYKKPTAVSSTVPTHTSAGQ